MRGGILLADCLRIVLLGLKVHQCLLISIVFPLMGKIGYPLMRIGLALLLQSRRNMTLKVQQVIEDQQ